MAEDNSNLTLWRSVERTNPKYTKKAKVGGNSITSISPQFQIMNVTEQFGSYGSTWGFKDIQLDYSLVNTPFRREKKEGIYPNQKVVGLEDAVMGLVVFKAIFFYPNGEFPIINSISLFTNNDMTKIDDNFAKKIETDALTKAISKLGFNADIFMGKFDDARYVEEMDKEFQSDNSAKLTDLEKYNIEMTKHNAEISKFTDVIKMTEYFNSLDNRLKKDPNIIKMLKTQRELIETAV